MEPPIFQLCRIICQLNSYYDADESTYTQFTTELNNNTQLINTKSHYTTLLNIAAKKGNARILKLLLEKGANVNLRDEDSSTPLISATYFKYTRGSKQSDHIYELLKHKPNLDLQDNAGDTALMVQCWGAQPDDEDIALRLIDMGANIFIEKGNHRIAVHDTICNCDHNMTVTAFTLMCEFNSPYTHKLQKKLISMGAHLDRIKKNRAGHELFTVCKNGNMYLVEELLKAGANIYHECQLQKGDVTTTTPAELIIRYKYLHCFIDYLYQIHPWQNKYLKIALKYGCHKYVELYIKKCADENLLDIVYSDQFIKLLNDYKCEIIIKRLKRDIFSSLFLILNRKSINKHIGYKIVELICSA
jgi:ankyrin repeat protein